MSVISPQRRKNVNQNFEKRCSKIRYYYDEAFPDPDEEKPKLNKIAEKRNLNLTTPRRRPLNVLKRRIYEYALEIENRDQLDALKEYVINRDKRFRQYRGGEADAIDWVIRLVSSIPLKKTMGSQKKLANSKPGRDNLFENSATPSRMGTELKFARRHKIHWLYVDMFIDAVGGYEHIHHRLTPKNMMRLRWVRGITIAAVESAESVRKS
jgi:hypothetical protein